MVDPNPIFSVVLWLIEIATAAIILLSEWEKRNQTKRRLLRMRIMMYMKMYPKASKGSNSNSNAQVAFQRKATARPS